MMAAGKDLHRWRIQYGGMRSQCIATLKGNSLGNLVLHFVDLGTAQALTAACMRTIATTGRRARCATSPSPCAPPGQTNRRLSPNA